MRHNTRLIDGKPRIMNYTDPNLWYSACPRRVDDSTYTMRLYGRSAPPALNDILQDALDSVKYIVVQIIKHFVKRTDLWKKPTYTLVLRPQETPHV
jgi:hypothetical protein